VSAAIGETRSGACGKSIGRRSAEPVDSSVAATSAKAHETNKPRHIEFFGRVDHHAVRAVDDGNERLERVHVLWRKGE
jgi:hypothetical protein